MACDLLKNPAEIVACAERKCSGNVLHGLVGAFQQNLGALDLGKFDVICHAQARLLFEFVGQIIFRIAHQRCNICSAYFFIEIHLNIVHTLLHLLAEMRVGAAFMHAPDKVVIHHERKRIEVVHRFCIFGRLDIAVPQCISFLRRKPALDGGTAYQRSKHDNARLALAQGVIAAHRNTRADPHTGRKRLLVVQISGAHHLQKPLLCHPDLVTVVRRLLHCTLSLRQRLAVDVADRKVVAGQTIVHHQGVAVQDRALQHRDGFQHLVQLHGPCHACFQTVIVLQPVFNPAQRNILIKHRPDDPGAFQRTAVLFKGSRPCHAKGRAERDRRCVSAAVVQHFFLTAE